VTLEVKDIQSRRLNFSKKEPATLKISPHQAIKKRSQNHSFLSETEAIFTRS
jgi:hypothetical protein